MNIEDNKLNTELIDNEKLIEYRNKKNFRSYAIYVLTSYVPNSITIQQAKPFVDELIRKRKHLYTEYNHLVILRTLLDEYLPGDNASVKELVADIESITDEDIHLDTYPDTAGKIHSLEPIC